MFTRYLLGRPPSRYVCAKYKEAHSKTPTLAESDEFDAFLVRIARRSPALTRLADSYATLFGRSTVLRKKLVLLLAILESSAPSYQAIDKVVNWNRGLTMLLLLLRGLAAIALALVATVVFLTARVIIRGGRTAQV